MAFTPTPGSFSGFLKYLPPTRIPDIFTNHKIRFTQPIALNDPLEFNPILSGFQDKDYCDFVIDGVSMPSTASWYKWHLVNVTLRSYGILSLSKQPISFDMWSHYADGHKGLLIELRPDFNLHPAFQATDGQALQVKPVQYKERFEININEMDDGTGHVDNSKFYDTLFFTKCNRWKDEAEYRLVRPLIDLTQHPVYKDIHLGEIPLELITSIVFGAKMLPTDKEKIIAACGEANISYFQSIILKDELDEKGLCGNIKFMHLRSKDMLKSASAWKFTEELVLDNNAIKQFGRTMQIKDFSQLPYYHLAKEPVTLFWSKRKASQAARRPDSTKE